MERYDDDELPDYIMVMIGNKRSRSDMTNDLNLFLAEDTPKFIKWLFDHMDELNNPGRAKRQKEREARGGREEGEIRDSRRDDYRSRRRSRSRDRQRRRSPRPPMGNSSLRDIADRATGTGDK